MRVNRYSPRTETAYLDWIKRFIRFHGVRHPQEMGAEEVKAFLSDLATRMHIAGSDAESNGLKLCRLIRGKIADCHPIELSSY